MRVHILQRLSNVAAYKELAAGAEVHLPEPLAVRLCTEGLARPLREAKTPDLNPPVDVSAPAAFSFSGKRRNR
jgi:hypothetical protein